ncbi:hypothetical protein NW766_009605 [Fusarium irregulare]|uniref:Uncharacterized protein n=1 Tax=Fusarium irregulare TaxID=2494466 RepID=A0A9W8U7I3_9HYPO|nr:hypothetical protein NW766_009605 [Fusarium irregulare]
MSRLLLLAMAATSTTEGLSASATDTATLTQEETTTAFVPSDTTTSANGETTTLSSASDTTLEISLSSTEAAAVETTTGASADTTGISTQFSTETTFSTMATSTIAETTTQAEVANPLQTVKLVAVGSIDPALAFSGSLGFSSLETISSLQFYMTFTSDVSSDQLFTVHKETGEVKALNGPSNAAGMRGSYHYFPGSGNPFGAAMIQSPGAPALNCRIQSGSGYQYLQCLFGTTQIADFWTCKQPLLLVFPGYDLTRCYMDGNTHTGYKIPIVTVTTV